jgi:hypothetical protein
MRNGCTLGRVPNGGSQPVAWMERSGIQGCLHGWAFLDSVGQPMFAVEPVVYAATAGPSGEAVFPA